MSALDQLVMLGYRVEKSQEHDDFDVWLIEGFGTTTYLRSDDLGAWAMLVDGHEERVSSIEQEL